MIFNEQALEIEKEKRANDIADNAIASQGDGKIIAQKIKALLS